MPEVLRTQRRRLDSQAKWISRALLLCLALHLAARMASIWFLYVR